MKNNKIFFAVLMLSLTILIIASPVLANEGHDSDGVEAEAVAHTHEVDPIDEGLINGLLSGGETFVYVTLAAFLPIFWILSLIVHFNRPYIIRYLKKFTLRFGADVWWLLYVMLRDAVLIITFIISLFFFFPNLFLYQPLPISGPLATVLLFWALTVKLTGDADDRAKDYNKVSYLLLAGAFLYLVPFLFGVEAPMEGWEKWRTFFTSSQNQSLAEIILYISIGLLFLTGGYIFTFVMNKVKQSVNSKQSINTNQSSISK
ncbi:hypothetical protein BHF71_01905 [Vulcanibacillus modesticaldus]|uniref:Uncharacterized protein n=1 Tax=Vulcanibacillus modesticaldus TaxID=337097 RepID=A0A1D2YUK4_9BACI|nr:hypothetical protein [Vulcanibacillus modesticaldus]OEF99367.1 hypothetical protein BHF71_01905 [Vulcanibacillus modesticaldus]